MMYWVMFTILGAPSVNHIDLFLIVAGVMWSLSYEWCFYMFSPLIALTTAQRPSWTLLALSMIALGVAWGINLQLQHASMFIGGIIAARLVRHQSFQEFFKSSFASRIVVFCLTTVFFIQIFFISFPGFASRKLSAS